MVCSNSNVILTRQTCGHHSSRVAGSKCRALAFYFSVRVWYVFVGGPEPLEKGIHKILGSKREDRFLDPFFDLVQNTSLVRFLDLLQLCSSISVRPAGHAKVPTEVPEDSRVLRVRRLWFPTSDRLETLLVPSRTTWSRQYHESTMV